MYAQQIIDWAKTHKQLLLIGFAAICLVVVIVGVWYMKKKRNSTTTTASMASSLPRLNRAVATAAAAFNAGPQKSPLGPMAPPQVPMPAGSSVQQNASSFDAIMVPTASYGVFRSPGGADLTLGSALHAAHPI